MKKSFLGVSHPKRVRAVQMKSCFYHVTPASSSQTLETTMLGKSKLLLPQRWFFQTHCTFRVILERDVFAPINMEFLFTETDLNSHETGVLKLLKFSRCHSLPSTHRPRVQTDHLLELCSFMLIMLLGAMQPHVYMNMYVYNPNRVNLGPLIINPWGKMK